MEDIDHNRHVAECVKSTFSLDALRREKMYYPSVGWVPMNDIETCVHIIQLISDNGLPWCAKCGTDPIHIKFEDVWISGDTRFLDFEAINNDFVCTSADEFTGIDCEHMVLKWTDQPLVRELLAADLIEARRLALAEQAAE